jgi:phosphoribosylformylglycinamidine synthase
VKPRTLILRTAGTNCDQETAYAFELAGATSQRVHLNQLIENPSLIGDYQLMAIPGGFSYGDDIAAGRIFANQIMHHLRDAFYAFVEAGKPIIGICNGFQVLVKTDLIPGPIGGACGQTATLTHNDSGRFICRWVGLKPVSQKCIWTRGLGPIELPIAHGEGKFVPASESVRQALHANDQIALVYDGENPNGSVDAIAGICDPSGVVLGLMPHPERHVRQDQHPAWTRRGLFSKPGDGFNIFRNAVLYAEGRTGVGV